MEIREEIPCVYGIDKTKHVKIATITTTSSIDNNWWNGMCKIIIVTTVYFPYPVYDDFKTRNLARFRNNIRSIINDLFKTSKIYNGTVTTHVLDRNSKYPRYISICVESNPPDIGAATVHESLVKYIRKNYFNNYRAVSARVYTT